LFKVGQGKKGEMQESQRTFDMNTDADEVHGQRYEDMHKT
jgi:hypothetical protein